MRFHEGVSLKDISNNFPKEITGLVERFLHSDARARHEIIKSVTAKDDEREGDKTFIFLDALITRLGANPIKYASFLSAVLERKALISRYSLNKRLQLAYLSSLWYNREN